MTRILLLVVAIGLVLGSASVKRYEAHTVRVPDTSDDALYTAAVRVLSEDGSSFRINDRASGVLATEWKNVIIGVDQSHHSWRVLVRDGTIRVSIDCERQMNDPIEGLHWTDCGDARNAEWVDQQPEIASRIKAQAVANPTAVPAAGSQQPVQSSRDGEEGGKCYGNGTCNSGLTCASNLCVKLPGSSTDGSSQPPPSSQR